MPKPQYNPHFGKMMICETDKVLREPDAPRGTGGYWVKIQNENRLLAMEGGLVWLLNGNFHDLRCPGRAGEQQGFYLFGIDDAVNHGQLVKFIAVRAYISHGTAL